MTRLVGDIHTARSERERMIQAVQHATVDMRRTVARMLTGFDKTHVDMARRQHRRLREFVSGLESAVATLRSSMRTDLAGARAVWCGNKPSAPPAREHKRAAKAAGG
ncbi:MAG: hypothetical protein HYS05_12450 [Acidobacteria bacterium]|nr:hypothetical protein [Acidobacteriota bacterium]